MRIAGIRRARSAALPPRPEASPGVRGTLGWAAAALAVVVWTAALTREPRRTSTVPDDLDTSVVATSGIKAAVYFQSVDLQKTKDARDLAGANVPDYYRVDRARVEAQLRALRARIDAVRGQREPLEAAVREALKASTREQPKAEVTDRAVMQFADRLLTDPAWNTGADAADLALWLTPDAASVPDRLFGGQPESTAPAAEAPAPAEPAAADAPAAGPEAGEAAAAAGGLAEAPAFSFTYGDRLAELAVDSLEFVLSQGVRLASLPPGASERPVVVLRDNAPPDASVSEESRLGDVPDPEQARELLAARLREEAKSAARDASTPGEWARLHEAAFALASPQIVDTIRYDDMYTAGALEMARNAVPQVMKEVYPGETIQEAGHRWTAQSKSDVQTYVQLLAQEDQPWRRVAISGIAHLLLALIVANGLRRAVALFGPGDGGGQTAEQHYLLALLLVTGALAAGRIAYYFEPSGFVLPAAAAGILYAILVNSRLAAMTGLAAALLVSAQYGYDWRLAVVLGAMTLAGSFGVDKVRRRSDMAAASIKATVAGLLVIVAVMLAVEAAFTEAALRRAGMIAINGGLCLLLVPALLSPLERLFGITTDITLLEYSDLNNELLTQLSIKAPGTYAHSQMLGLLAEAAADAIGANGLKARVSALYHDIGKMRRSDYFTENQSGYNIHDDIKPRQSARAIRAHVIQGADMAREYHLPKPIVDGILEHHGTCRIGRFYELALEQNKHGDIREEDFRYPGPRPQSPETAILMICDASESGIRSIKNPTEERIREFIQGIIAARQADRQFDECNLTLRQLDTIAGVIAQRVVSSQHTRVAYPSTRRPEDDEEKANIIPLAGGAK